ncbi:MAG: ClpXP protease specificity-enhancing factor [Zoogloeaceae bacterium]|jgi:stringent starvation protein B|nr:ClpXP protease specificity-enhancing factor [Zoogloeaceae bacterium]
MDAQLPALKPYLARALYEWCADNGLTPYMSVAVDASCRVPQGFVRDGQIVFNIGPEATDRLQMQNDFITFRARFNGVAQEVWVPVARVAALYARENGQGMAFEVTATEDAGAANTMEKPEDSPESPPPPSGKRSERPWLRRVK